MDQFGLVALIFRVLSQLFHLCISQLLGGANLLRALPRISRNGRLLWDAYGCALRRLFECVIAFICLRAAIGHLFEGVVVIDCI